MRQVGSLTNHEGAQRFLAYLVTQRIDAQLEQSGDRWIVWVHEEDRVPAAKAALAEFVADPEAPKYQDAKKQAESLLRDEQNKRRQAQKNVVDMRSRWGSGGGATARKAPLMISLAGLAVLVSLLTGSLFSGQRSSQPENSALYALEFADSRAAVVAGNASVEETLKPASPFAEILRGQVWRLVTPIFLHFTVAHLVFNLYWFWILGGQIEDIRGATKLALLVLITGILSNVAQAATVGPNFGGLSGVVYGLLGYLWMRVRHGNAEGYQLSNGALVISLVWFVLCIARQEPSIGPMITFIPNNVANVAHGVGLIAGVGLGLLPDEIKAASK